MDICWVYVWLAMVLYVNVDLYYVSYTCDVKVLSKWYESIYFLENVLFGMFLHGLHTQYLIVLTPFFPFLTKV